MKKLILAAVLAVAMPAWAANGMPETVRDILRVCDATPIRQATNPKQIAGQLTAFAACRGYLYGMLDGMRMASFAAGVNSCMPEKGMSTEYVLEALKIAVEIDPTTLDDTARVGIAKVVYVNGTCTKRASR